MLRNVSVMRVRRVRMNMVYGWKEDSPVCIVVIRLEMGVNIYHEKVLFRAERVNTGP